jgi:ABC-type Na+ efflux pump permease subunit
MSTILTIASREVKRLRSGFSGRSRPVVVVVLGISLLVSYLSFRQGLVLSKGIYRIGLAPGAPALLDSRFQTTRLDRALASVMLQRGKIDLYVDEQGMSARPDDRSLQAAGAAERYLERVELARIAEQHQIDNAFPLRVEVNYLPAPGGSAVGEGPSLADLVGEFSGTSASDPEELSPGSGDEPPPGSGAERATDAAVREQIWELSRSSDIPKIDLEFATDKDVIVPSLMRPPIPFAQVIVAFLYVLPICFISVFFTSSFMTEKTDRRISVLLSAPVSPLQVILGKLLPYALFSVAAVIAITIVLKGDLLMALAIFLPVILFVFAIYLMVPLLYRTFKDTTFISMLAVSTVTGYLVFPAMFSGINDFAYLSPLTLAVKMYRAEPFDLGEYLFSAAPMALLFFLSLYVATRILNEEYLMGFRPLYRKIAEAVYLAMDRHRPYLSTLLLSGVLIPVVYMTQLVALAISTNLPIRYIMGGLLLMAAIVEEAAKSVGIAMLMEKRVVRSARQVIVLSLLSALGFLIGEKALLYFSLGVVWESALSEALLGSRMLLIPLAAHFVFTSIVCLLTRKTGFRRYPLAVLAGSIVHGAYNLFVLGAFS